jgi:transmembrane sensor
MRSDARPPSFNGLPIDHATRLVDTWDRLAEAAPLAPPAGAPSTAEAWAALAPRLAAPTPRRRAADRPMRGWRHAPLAATSAVLSAVVLSALLWWVHAPAALHVPAGGQGTVILPDGSTAELSGDTRLSYRRGFRAFPLRAASERAVRLEGEAFFTVVPGMRAFTVHTHNAVVEVVGTAFNVRARSGESLAATRVAVARGAVRVIGPTGDGATVRPRESAEVAAGGIITTTTDPGPVAVWRNGGFAIHERPLADVLREVERRFGVTIRGAPDLPYDLPLTLYYSRVVDAETVLHDITLAAGLHYRPLRGGYDVVRRPAPNP